jgi:hypothetical protein
MIRRRLTHYILYYISAGGLKSSAKAENKRLLPAKNLQVCVVSNQVDVHEAAAPRHELSHTPKITARVQVQPCQPCNQNHRICPLQVSPSMEHLKLGSSGSTDSLHSMDSVLGDPDNGHLPGGRRSNLSTLLPR